MSESEPVPEGYERYAIISYPDISEWASFSRLLISILVFYGVLILNQPDEVLLKIYSALESPKFHSLFSIALVFISTVIATTLAHELVHGIVYSLKGYEVEYGIADNRDALYAGAFNQRLSRKFDLFAIASPTLFLNIPALYLVFSAGLTIAFSAATLLSVNVTMALFDFYALSRIWNTPADSVIVHHRPEEFCIYIPK